MNLPNKLTLARIILIPFFIAVFYMNFTGHYFVALGIFAVASLTDFFDGYIARKYDLVTDLGKFMDPIADKVLVLASLVVMLADPNVNVFRFAGDAFYVAGGIGVAIIVAREMVVSSLRMIAAKKGVVLAAEKIGKVKTFMTDVAIIVLLIGGDMIVLSHDVGAVIDYIGLAFFALSVILTIVSGISYLVKNAGVFKEQ